MILMKKQKVVTLMAKCQFVITGKRNTERVGRMLTQMKNNYQIIGNEIVDSNAELFYNALMDTINEQDFPPLSQSYLERKGLLGLDTRILIATGEYLSNIQIRRVNGLNGKTARHVGVDSRTKHSGTDLTMSDLALIMEYGTSDGRIPPRPHYGKTWERILPQVRRNTLEIARKMVR